MRTPSDPSEYYFREFYEPLHRYFYFRLSDRFAVDDLVQTTFLKFIKHSQKETSHEHLVRLLYTIARTTLIDYFRQRHKFAYSDIETVPDHLAAADTTPEYDAQRGEIIDEVHAALSHLSETERDIVTMRMAEVEYATIAHVHNLSESNARKIYSRACQKLQSLIPSYETP